MTVSLQPVTVSLNTDASGYATVTFDTHIDHVIASGASPQAGGGSGILSVTATVTGDKTARVRVFLESGTTAGQFIIAANKTAINVTLLGIAVT